jgi:hypothetical protein
VYSGGARLGRALHLLAKLTKRMPNSERFNQRLASIINKYHIYLADSSIVALSYLAENVSERNGSDFLSYFERYYSDYVTRNNHIDSGLTVRRMYRDCLATKLV